MRIHISIEGQQEAIFALQRFSHAASDVRPALAEIDADIRQMFQLQFASEGQYRSGGWKPLAASTIRKRLKADPKDPLGILIRTTRLYRGATATGSVRDKVRQISRGELVSGTRVPYAIYHHSKKPRRKLPRRPLIEVTTEDTLGFAKRIQAYLVFEGRRRIAF